MTFLRCLLDHDTTSTDDDTISRIDAITDMEQEEYENWYSTLTHTELDMMSLMRAQQSKTKDCTIFFSFTVNILHNGTISNQKNLFFIKFIHSFIF